MALVEYVLIVPTPPAHTPADSKAKGGEGSESNSTQGTGPGNALPLLQEAQDGTRDGEGKMAHGRFIFDPFFKCLSDMRKAWSRA